jgi:hypothetical protein
MKFSKWLLGVPWQWSVPGNVFPVLCFVILPWPPVRASFLFLPSPIPVLLRGFLYEYAGCSSLLRSWADLGQHQNYVSAVLLNFVWWGSQGWNPFPGAVVPTWQFSLGSVPRYQEGTFVWYVWANNYHFVSHMWRFVWRVIVCKM